MDEAFRKQALEWFKRGDHDIETARLLFDKNGYTDIIAFHIHQAVEKYLKGFLVFHYKKPPRIHDLDILLSQNSAIDKDFKKFIDICEKASVYYIEARYPPGHIIEHEYSEIEEDLDKAMDLICMIRSKLKYGNNS